MANESQNRALDMETAELIQELHRRLEAHFGPDFSYQIAARGNIVAQSNINGTVVPMSAYEQGYKAFNERRGTTDNPYRYAHPNDEKSDYWQWFAGWRLADRQSEDVK